MNGLIVNGVEGVRMFQTFAGAVLFLLFKTMLLLITFKETADTGVQKALFFFQSFFTITFSCRDGRR